MSTCFTKFKRSAFITAFAGCTAAMIMGATPALALTPSSTCSGPLCSAFELGPTAGTPEAGITNIIETSAAPGTDWAELFAIGNVDSNGHPINLFGGLSGVFVADQVSASSATDDSVYTGQSDTNSEKVTDWSWTTGNVPAKDDVTNSYAYIKEVVVGGETHTMLFVGAEREVPNGDAHIDFEFFQDSVALDRTGVCPSGVTCKFVGENIHAGETFGGKTFPVGDLLVSMDFTNGGDIAGLSIRTRTDTGADSYSAPISTNGQGCLNDSVNGNSVVCAFSNGDTISNGNQWISRNNHGDPITSLAKNAFTEWGIDLTGLGLGHPCFPSILVKTRSSQSFSAQLKDFALRGFESCDSAISTKIVKQDGSFLSDETTTGQVVGGTQVHDVATVSGSAGQILPTGTVTFERFDNGNCTAPAAETSAAVQLVNGQAKFGTTPTAPATFQEYTTVAGQSISYKATYSGDNNYPSKVSGCESLTVPRISTLVTTKIIREDTNVDAKNTAVNTSGATVQVHDQAEVTATLPTGAPQTEFTGKVTFSRSANADCSNAITEDVQVTPGTTDFTTPGIAKVTVDSSQFPLTQNGATFLCFRAQYDVDNSDKVYETSLLSTKEPLCAYPFQ